MKEFVAFAPGHITGFFQICDQPTNLLMKGSRGAGVSIEHGVTTRVGIERSTRKSFKIMMNGRIIRSAKVSESVINTFFHHIKENYRITVKYEAKIPIGCGFGSSGAGALSLALALNEAFNLGLSPTEVAQIAHIAEVKCKTGLGSVIAETFGGLEIRVKPGAPGIGKIKHIPISRDYVVVCLNFGPILTKKILTSEEFSQRINKLGGKFVVELVKQPSLSNFMKLSRNFAESVGLISERMRKVFEDTDNIGLICSMPMFGECVFSLVKHDVIEEILKIFYKHASSKHDIIVAKIDFEGARLL
jgi:pantoate kinase